MSGYDIKLFTWKDVERRIRSFFKDKSIPYINDIEVYSDTVIVEINDSNKVKDIDLIMTEIFDDQYDKTVKKIFFDLSWGEMDVLIEIDDVKEKKKIITPLFKRLIFEASSYDEKMLKDTLPGSPVIAFHSYKGGVGRTLSLLAFVKAWSSNAPDSKILIVDSDLEAPGITWLLDQDENRFSFLDLLEMLQSSEKIENLLEKVSNVITQTTVSVDTGKVIAEHFVLPTYRYKEQLLDIYSTPESIARGYKKRFILAEFLSLLGDRIGASAIFVDLRAGISEFSAPLLFDPRVKKYIVTSTSQQSVIGTKILLEQICKGLPVSEEMIVPEILMTMTQEWINTSGIAGELLEVFDMGKNQTTTDNLITELPFASELVHLTSLDQIMQNLEGREFYNRIKLLVSDYYLHDTKNENKIESREEVIFRIHNMAEKQINAEGNSEFKVLMTNSINNLMKKYTNSVPQVIVLGEKGSGKTFLFREMIRNQTWQSFNKLIRQNNGYKTIFIPLLAPRNGGDFTNLLKTSIKMFNESISFAKAGETYWYDIYEEVMIYKKEDHDLIEWKEFWRNCIKQAFQKDRDLKIIDTLLKENKQQVIFLIDGLEELFEDTLENDNEKRAIRALVQEIVTEFKTKYDSLGIIVFLRKDLATNAITVNYEQFESQYKSYALNWSQDEALKLALWLVVQAVPEFYQETVDVSQISKDVIEKYLIRLWGVKLGKNNSNEAYASRWILAALSDFNSQLQARDIIRFLQNATENRGDPIYEDRYIMPAEIRKAVERCSSAKVVEIEDEIAALKPVFEKLRNVSNEKKVLPFTSEEFDLSAQQEKLLKQEGFLKFDNDKYYMPEIIRHALGFKYQKGARPKVLSLLFQKK